MSIERTQESIRIMQAWLDGSTVQARGILPDDRDWADMDSCGAEWTAEVGPPLWNWGNCEYRIKPEPRVIHVLVSQEGNLGSLLWDTVEGAERIILADPGKWSGVAKFVEVLP